MRLVLCIHNRAFFKDFFFSKISKNIVFDFYRCWKTGYSRRSSSGELYFLVKLEFIVLSFETLLLRSDKSVLERWKFSPMYLDVHIPRLNLYVIQLLREHQESDLFNLEYDTHTNCKIKFLQTCLLNKLTCINSARSRTLTRFLATCRQE